MTSKNDIDRQVSRGLAWVGAASSLVWVLDLVGMWAILHFFVSKEEFGTAMLAVTLFPAIDLASEMGLGSAVIQRDDHTRDKLSTLFWVNVGSSSLLAALLAFVVGPTLAWFHSAPIVSWMLAAYAGKLLWQNVITVPQSLMKKQLRFKELSAIRTASNIAEFSAKIGFAAAGFGVWAIVLGPLSRALVVGIGVQLRNPWLPRLVFRFRETRSWIVFGIKSSASQLLYQLYTNLDYQVVGYMFGKEANGAYSAAYELVIKPCHVIAQTLTSIAFPAYARIKADRAKLFDQFVSFARLSLVTMLAVVAIVFVVAEELLEIVNPDYVEAATAARILCGVAVLRAVSYVIPPLLDALGRPGLGLRYNAVATLVLPPLFWIGASAFGDSLGYDSVAWAWLIGYPIAFAVLLWLAFALLGASLSHFVRRIAGIPMCATIAIGSGLAAISLVQHLAVGVRLGVGAGVSLGVFGVLLAYTQGISPRTVSRSLKG